MLSARLCFVQLKEIYFLTFDNVLLEEQTFLNERISAFFRYISNIYNIYDKLCRSTKKNYEVLLEKILIPERPGFYSH